MCICHSPSVFESMPHKQNYKQIYFWQQRIFWPILLPAECLESFKLMAANAREREIKELFIPLERDLFPLAFRCFLSALAEETLKNAYKHQEFPYSFTLWSLGVYKLWDRAKGWRWPFKRNPLFCVNHLVQQRSKRLYIYIYISLKLQCGDTLKGWILHCSQCGELFCLRYVSSWVPVVCRCVILCEGVEGVLAVMLVKTFEWTLAALRSSALMPTTQV